MIRFTRMIPLALAVGAVLAGCTSTEPQTPPASTAVSNQSSSGTDTEEKPAESPEQAATVSTDWEDTTFSAQGGYTANDVTLASKTVEDYIAAAFANGVFLDGSWTQEPTGERIASELEDYFTQARLDFIATLDPKSTDPNVLSDVNSVVFLLYPEGEAPAWKQEDKVATVSATGLTFTEEPTTKALKATFNVVIEVPVQTKDSQGTSTTTYTMNTWLIKDDGAMKIDGYANSWKTTPYSG